MDVARPRAGRNGPRVVPDRRPRRPGRPPPPRRRPSPRVPPRLRRHRPAQLPRPHLEVRRRQRPELVRRRLARRRTHAPSGHPRPHRHLPTRKALQGRPPRPHRTTPRPRMLRRHLRRATPHRRRKAQDTRGTRLQKVRRRPQPLIHRSFASVGVAIPRIPHSLSHSVTHHRKPSIHPSPLDRPTNRRQSGGSIILTGSTVFLYPFGALRRQ
mmetsp:Transcript_14034/g.45810  ORF Transcript_14034/g.45810 Transcript_14034/m.45810 type:complete len:212 (+) Transcript_14034:685-1320(+)